MTDDEIPLTPAIEPPAHRPLKECEPGTPVNGEARKAHLIRMATLVVVLVAVGLLLTILIRVNNELSLINGAVGPQTHKQTTQLVKCVGWEGLYLVDRAPYDTVCGPLLGIPEAQP